MSRRLTSKMVDSSKYSVGYENRGHNFYSTKREIGESSASIFGSVTKGPRKSDESGLRFNGNGNGNGSGTSYEYAAVLQCRPRPTGVEFPALEGISSFTIFWFASHI
ncbi:hypothetical protein V1477_020051 [Vespula maculifrons]|uniref:Uncharacterized protein n=1 Tax=Vespula maculifrons TaxID=7453 RepID=A0ABD2AKV4_VESMC